jgi:hypothetical protein
MPATMMKTPNVSMAVPTSRIVRLIVPSRPARLSMLRSMVEIAVAESCAHRIPPGGRDDHS